MSIQRITTDNIEVFRLFTYPERSYTSSSSGITGSVSLFTRSNSILKDATANEDYGESVFTAKSLEADLKSIKDLSLTTVDISPALEQYLDSVNKTPPSEALNKRLEITRFTPSAKFTKDTLRKSTVKDVLFPYYRARYGSVLNWSFTNYHCLNFFTGSTVPSTSALIYPAGSGSTSGNYFHYVPTGSFTFEFYINPKHKNDYPGADFKAGSIFHMSSSYAVSLISGSTIDENGYLNSFKIMLQLSHSADIPPSQITPGISGFTTSLGPGYKPDLIYTSSNIPWNEWTHVSIRWESPSSGPIENAGQHTGSFVINGILDNIFTIPSSSVFPSSFTNPQGDPDALFIGNYFDGPNNQSLVGTPLISRFFNAWHSFHDGITSFYPTTFVDENTAYDPVDPTLSDMDPSKYKFEHPLNAEIHDIRIYEGHRTLGQISQDLMSGPESLTPDLLFYLPVLFVKETRARDVLQTPFKKIRSTTDDPFNVAMSFGVGGRLINLPNFTREFSRAEYPRLFHLTASEITTTTTAQPANNLLYQSPSVAKANLTILPCDNGLFIPRFELLRTGSNPMSEPPALGSLTDRFQSDLGSLRYDLVSLRNLVSTSSYVTQISPIDSESILTGTISSALQGATPEDPGIEAGPLLTILDRTRDPSSNEVTFFDVSNLFYGQWIEPGSLTISDSSLTGSGGKVPMTVKDNRYGVLYRADCLSPHATWSSIGSTLYEEGISVITDPTAILFGQDQFEVSLKGRRPIFVKEINVLAPAGSINSSSNPDWKSLRPTDYDNETANQFVYITQVNLHDDNFNIIGKANLAQPLVKRSDDKYLIRIKMDY
jgi:hypothetical protein